MEEQGTENQKQTLKRHESARQELLAQAFCDPKMAQLARELHKRHNLFGPQDSQKAYLLAALSERAQRPLALLVADELRARSLVEALKAFAIQEESVAVLRPRETALTAADAVSHEAERARLAVLTAWMRGECRLLVVVAGALLQRMPAPGEFVAGMLKIEKGQCCAPEFLEQALQNLGFERAARAESPGEYARRGDILDALPLSLPGESQASRGYRISFFDDEIDDLRLFDPEDQRSVEGAECAYFAPTRELPPYLYSPEKLAAQLAEELREGLVRLRKHAASEELQRAFRSGIEKEIDELNSGRHCPSLERWSALIFEDSHTLLDYLELKDALVVVDEPAQFKKRLDAAQADFHQRLEGLLLKGQTAALAAETRVQAKDCLRQLDGRRQILSLASLRSSGNGFPDAQELSVGGRDAERFHGQDEKLLAWLRTMAAAGERIHLLVAAEGQLTELRAFAARNGLAVRIIERELRAGFIYPDARLIVCGAQDLFGQQRRRKKSTGKNALRINFFSDLQAGEKVVHENYGIGLYEGITNTTDASGVRRDYLTVTYAQNEKLYLPMEQLGLLQKYVGSEGKELRLSRLGGNEWQRQKERARSSIRKLAVDLVKLYSQRQLEKGHAFSPESVWDREFADRFPYDETDDQLRCIREIAADMESERVMDRLLCGDVGFGKTEVAFRAIFKCVQDGYQAALLAPTTVLAQQHYQNFLERVGDFPLKVGLLSRFATAAERAKTVRGLRSGAIDVVVGTHRILSKDVSFKKLGLLVVDEEQRFGVDHKEKLKALTPSVDVLSMSATPIPRTLHLSMSGIRDISVLEEAPEDRRSVQTYVMEYDEGVVQEAILREIARGGQVFYLHNNTRSIDQKARQLEQALPGARIAVGHGKMSERELEDVIFAFVKGETDVLVCTTIIESGIDMPRVNSLIVEDADRMGLAQLYQLRGRVGRSERQAYAYITYRREKVLNEIAEKRLATIRDFTELGAGFKIALRDLEVRGAGNLLGAEQHGQMDAIGYDLYTRMLDEEIRQARAEAGEAEQGAASPPSVECVVEFKLDAYINPEYIADDGERMDIYRRIARIDGLELYRDVMDELLDRYGEPSPTLVALMDVAYIRARAGRMGMERIAPTKESCVLSFGAQLKPDMEQLSLLMNLPDYKGRLLFNAGTKPFVVFRGLGADVLRYPEQLRRLFGQLEEAGPAGAAQKT